MECSPSYWDLDPDGLSLLVERGFRTSNEIERERERGRYSYDRTLWFSHEKWGVKNVMKNGFIKQQKI